MEYVIIGIIVVVAITAGVGLFLQSKKKGAGTILGNGDERQDQTETRIIPVDNRLKGLAIQIEMLPAGAIQDEDRLVEITDSKVLAHINNLIPGLVQVGNAANNAAQVIQANGEVLYRAIIPTGAKLADSKAMEGAVRGIYHGPNGIQGHANLVAVEAQKGTAFIANAAASAMGVASMIVGQYYMARINDQMDKISDGISKISDFQNNEYRSRVYSLITHAKRIADFQVEILENTELRISKLSQLDSLEEECTQLFGQANLTLASYTKQNDLDYNAYEKELLEVQNWYMYQKSLLDVLYRISELRYTLHLGSVSREHCASLLPTYTKQVVAVQTRLTEWHKKTAERLQIDVSAERRKRDGFDGVVHSIPGVFKENLNFRPIEKSTAKIIKMQSASNTYEYDLSDLYADDVRIISKNGKIYYLPNENSGA